MSFDATIEKKFNFNRYHPVEPVNGISINHIKKGATIKTAGGHLAMITGRKTRMNVQIKILEGEMQGQFDWISRDAYASPIT